MFVGVVWSSRISSGCGDIWIINELHRQFFFLLRLWNGCGLLDLFGDFPSATNNVRPTQRGAAWLLKDLFVIFVFLGVFCTVRCFF
jgi:hypothetical protein